MTDKSIAIDGYDGVNQDLEDEMVYEADVERYATADDDERVPEAHQTVRTGPQTRDVLVRKTTKQSWSQAKTIQFKDMTLERLNHWVNGMNEVQGWAKYRSAEEPALKVAGVDFDEAVETNDVSYGAL